MTTQQELFSMSQHDQVQEFRTTPASGHKMREVSKEARPSRASAAAQRSRALEFIRSRGKQGATFEEVSLGTGIPEKSLTWRKAELRAEGSIVATDRKRPTKSGSKATVFVARGFQ